MERIQVSENFNLDEFIDPHTYFNDADNGRGRLDIRLIPIAQRLRTLYGNAVYINNWWSTYKKHETTKSIAEIIEIIENDNRLHKWSSIRTTRTTIGSVRSAHRMGKAIDPKGDEKGLYKTIKDNAKEFHALGVRRLEDISITKGWLHIDTLELNTKPNSIRIVDLTKCTETLVWA